VSSPSAADIIDDRLLRGLHVEAVRRSGLRPEREPHVIFQTATLDALFEGRFDGDLTIAELAQHGDLGLGTLNGLDGELVVVDGRFLRADLDGRLHEVAPDARTPFAVVTAFSPDVEFTLDGPLEHDELLAELDRRGVPGAPVQAVRIDGRFDVVHARSVPRHEPPYPSLSAIAHEQHVFDLHDIEGTIVGFRFPTYAQGIEVPGFHLHVADAARRRGGHVLACRAHGVTVRMEGARELHVELPPGVELGEPGEDAAGSDRIRDVEGG
jgi:acetolactate decarboxylase